MAYTKTPWVNGVTPAINDGNLNNIEDGIKTNDDKLVNTFSADINAYFGNTKLGDDFQDESIWTSGLGTQSADTINVKIGNQSLKILENNNTAGLLSSDKNNISLDFSKLGNDEISTDADYIEIILFVSDATFVDTMRITFDQDTPFTGTNRKFFIPSVITGFNFIKVKKSDFTTTGSGAWTGIQSIRIQWESLANAQDEFISFQLIQLVKKDPLSLIPNPFQRFGVRDFEINSGEWFVGEEFGEIVWKILDAIGDFNTLQNNREYKNFTINQIRLFNTASDAYVTWFINDSNLIQALINPAGALTLRKREGGVTTSLITTIPIPLKDDILNYTLTKSDNNVSLKTIVNEQEFIQTFTTTLNGQSGNLAIGTTSNTMYIKATSITEISHAHHSDISETTKDFRIDDLIQSHTNIEWLGGTW